jgi:hypothetical protein
MEVFRWRNGIDDGRSIDIEWLGHPETEADKRKADVRYR